MCAHVLRGRRRVGVGVEGGGGANMLVCAHVCFSFFFFMHACVTSSPPRLTRSCHLWHGLVSGTTPAAPAGPKKRGGLCGRRYVVPSPWLRERALVLNYIIELKYTEEHEILSAQYEKREGEGKGGGGVPRRLVRVTRDGTESTKGRDGVLRASSSRRKSA